MGFFLKKRYLVIPLCALLLIVVFWYRKTILSYPIVDDLLTLIRSHPKASAGISAGLALIAFVIKDFIKEIWGELKPRWAKPCADWIDEKFRFYISCIFLRFRYQYCTQLYSRHHVLDARGLRTQGTFPLELERVFIELRFAPQNPQTMSSNLLQSAVSKSNSDIWSFLVSQQNKYRCLLIIGRAGSGKTTLLKKLLIVLVQKKQRHYDKRCRSYLPILLFLRNYVDEITSENPPTLAELATIDVKNKGIKPPMDWFEKKLKANRCLVLLDGFDEMPSIEKQNLAAKWIDEQIQLYEKTRFIITSRPHGYRSTPLQQVAIIEIQPLTMEQVQYFIEKWLVNNRSKDPENNKDDMPDIVKEVDNLIYHLSHTPKFKELVVNPLLLTMIMMVHQYRNPLPHKRIELYTEICDVLLNRWQITKGINNYFSLPQKRTVLQALAFHLMEEAKTKINMSEAESIIRESLINLGQSELNEPTTFLRDIENESGLLFQDEIGYYRFVHLSFQEYLAASYLLEIGRGPFLLAQVANPWWHETIQLYVAQGDATEIIRACLKSYNSSVSKLGEQYIEPEEDIDDTRSYIPITEKRREYTLNDGLREAQLNYNLSTSIVAVLNLAYESLNEAKTVNPKIRTQLNSQLLDELESSDPNRRQLGSQVMLLGRLRHLFPLNQNIEIDQLYISCAEYQLFLDETRTANNYRVPDHWKNTRFARGSALQPITGVRYSDAVAFCAWLTNQIKEQGSNKDVFYRLPTVDELKSSKLTDYGVTDERYLLLKTDTVGTWCNSEHPMVFGVALLIQNKYRELLNHIIMKYLDIARNRAHALEMQCDDEINIDLNSDNQCTYGLNLDEIIDFTNVSECTRSRAKELIETLSLIIDRRNTSNQSRDFELEAEHKVAIEFYSSWKIPLQRNSTRLINYTGTLERARFLVLYLAGIITIPKKSQEVYRIGLRNKFFGKVSQEDVSDRIKCINSFVGLILLEERIKENACSCEGIRVIRERTTSTETIDG